MNTDPAGDMESKRLNLRTRFFLLSAAGVISWAAVDSYWYVPRMYIEGLEDRIDCLRQLYALCTGAVALGLLFEYGPGIWKRLTGSQIEIEWPRREFIAGVLITFGVLGELGAEVCTFFAERRLSCADQQRRCPPIPNPIPLPLNHLRNPDLETPTRACYS